MLTYPCGCTLIEQDESCPVGYPSLLCDTCDGKGHITERQLADLVADYTLVFGDGKPSPRGLIQTCNMSEAQIAEIDRLSRGNTRQARRQAARLAKKARAK
jgi:hypothetical protein